MAEVYTYREGGLYHPTQRQWPERAEYNYRSGGHELVLFYPQPSAHEVQAIKRGTVEVALYTEGDLLLLLHRFGDLPWSDSPYSWHLLRQALPEQATLPPPLGEGEESRTLLTVILVNAATGVIRALRVVSLSPAFTTALHLAILSQAQRPWPGEAYDRQLADLYRRYPTTEALVARAQSRTVAGRGGAS